MSGSVVCSVKSPGSRISVWSPWSFPFRSAIRLRQRSKVAPNSPRELSHCTLSDVKPPLLLLCAAQRGHPLEIPAIGLHQRSKVAPNSPRELSHCTLSDVKPPLLLLCASHHQDQPPRCVRMYLAVHSCLPERQKCRLGRVSENRES